MQCWCHTTCSSALEFKAALINISVSKWFPILSLDWSENWACLYRTLSHCAFIDSPTFPALPSVKTFLWYFKFFSEFPAFPRRFFMCKLMFAIFCLPTERKGKVWELTFSLHQGGYRFHWFHGCKQCHHVTTCGTELKKNTELCFPQISWLKFSLDSS